jgi:hypothetical protein
MLVSDQVLLNSRYYHLQPWTTNFHKRPKDKKKTPFSTWMIKNKTLNQPQIKNEKENMGSLDLVASFQIMYLGLL